MDNNKRTDDGERILGGFGWTMLVISSLFPPLWIVVVIFCLAWKYGDTHSARYARECKEADKAQRKMDNERNYQEYKHARDDSRAVVHTD